MSVVRAETRPRGMARTGKEVARTRVVGKKQEAEQFFQIKRKSTMAAPTATGAGNESAGDGWL